MSGQSVVARLDEACALIRSRAGARAAPRVGVVLGSGLGKLARELDDAVSLPYREIPHFPASAVPGHEGSLVLGKVSGVSVAALSGRVHLYEGWSPDEIVFAVRTLARLGVKCCVLTNAAGGIDRSLAAGDLMLVTDHLNLSGRNPLTGPHEEALGPRFPDMTEAYSKRLRALAKEAAGEVGVSLKEGVYCVLSGPSYETPAEIGMLERLGASAVGMSTVPETIALRQMGVGVLAISLIANLAAGISPAPLTHREVVETGERVSRDFVRLLKAVLPRVA